ncbi:hypothetical protein BDV06DRAFT_225199 [Aspergillus oleicola]
MKAGSASSLYNASVWWQILGMSTGSTSFGHASAIIASTLGQPTFQAYMNIEDAPATTGAMNSLFYVGGFFGALFNAWFVDRFGRKASIGTACAIMVVSCALCAGSVHVAMFILFRFTTGWSCLMLLMSVPLWITEFAPPGYRGMLATIHAVMATFGYMLAAWVGIGFYYLQAENKWRGPLALACLPPLMNLVILPFIPESPRYLLISGKETAARAIIERRYVKASANPDSTQIAQTEFARICAQLTQDRSLDASWKVVFVRPSYRRRALIACSLLAFLYSSGTLTVTNYGPILFADLGYSAAQTLFFQAGITSMSLVCTFGSMWIVDRIPRNIIIGGGLITVAIPLACEAAMTAKFLNTDNQAGLAAGVAFLYIYIAVYAVFLDGPGYFYAGEIFPTHLRGKGTTLCVVSYSLVNILWTQVSPTAFDGIGWRFYIVFICCAVVSGIIALVTFPDTRNLPLEDIAALFGDDDLVTIYTADGLPPSTLAELSGKEE